MCLSVADTTGTFHLAAIAPASHLSNGGAGHGPIRLNFPLPPQERLQKSDGGER